MKSKTMMVFYQQLGKIFYAVAAADKKVREEEWATLKQILKKQWLEIEDTHDEFGTDSAYQIEIVFDWLKENHFETDRILADFKIFKKEHEHLFTEKTNLLILKTAHAIAASFSGKNKSELVILSQLQFILLRKASSLSEQEMFN